MEDIVNGLTPKDIEILKLFFTKYVFGGLGLFGLIKIASVIIHNKKQRKLQTDQFEKELFEKFNSKYDRLNENCLQSMFKI